MSPGYIVSNGVAIKHIHLQVTLTSSPRTIRGCHYGKGQVELESSEFLGYGAVLVSYHREGC